MGASRIAAQHRPVAGECRRRIPIVIEPPSQPLQRELLDMVAERHGHPIVPLEPGLMGRHGAGFTHRLFAGEAPQVALKLMAEGNGSLTFALISSRLGIDHRIHVAKSAARGNGPNYPDLEVDVEAVLELTRQP
jgi:hypothetical protein